MASSSETEKFCGGSILDAIHVLTAAHCVFDKQTRSEIPSSQIEVLAGSSDFEIPEPEEQDILASEVRVHPYYVYEPESEEVDPDDVAILALNKPLTFGPAVQPISLIPASSPLQESSAVHLTGFGLQSVNPLEWNGKLYSLGMTLMSSEPCGGEADALLLCASTPTGSLCSGDSGSGLTVPTGPGNALVGVVDTVQVISGESCSKGAIGGFANVSAPEIQDFIDGDESPP